MTDKAVSPLRQRMIEDMTIRKLAPKTQHDYVQRVKHFAAFLGRSPDSASLPVRVLSRLFRRLLLERLLAAHKAGRLKFFGGHAALADAQAFAAYLTPPAPDRMGRLCQ